MRFLTSLAVLAILLWGSTASAQWDETFAGDVLPDQLEDKRIVVAADGPEATEVGETLADQLKAAGASDAMTNPVFDDIGERSDQEVVEELEHLPVDVIVVLRTFADSPPDEEADDGEEGVAEEADSGMMTIYAVDGTAITGFMVYPGQPLTTEQRRDVGRGVSREVVEAAGEAVESEDNDFPEGGFWIEKEGGDVHLSHPDLSEPIQGAQIYELLGEEQLAAEYRDNAASLQTRRRSGLALAGLGGVAILGGLVLVQRGGSSDHSENDASGSTGAGLLVAGCGVAVGTIGGLGYANARGESPHPLEPEEIVERVENRGKGGNREGIEGDEEAGKESSSTIHRTEIAPAVSAGDDTALGVELRFAW